MGELKRVIAINDKFSLLDQTKLIIYSNNTFEFTQRLIK